MSENASPRPARSQPSTIELLKLAAAVIFVTSLSGWVWFYHGHLSLTLVFAAAVGLYMAMNIGANDVANNVGPAVGSRAMSLRQAIVIAAIFEAVGAIVAGGNVVSTIRGGIIDPADVADAQTFIWLMLAALMAAALWLNVATAVGAPVSTTHSIVGGVLGAGIAAAGWGTANWATVGQIAASWVISPLFGGLVGAALLYLIKRSITYRADLVSAARSAVPLLLGLMGWAFGSFMVLKGISKLVQIEFWTGIAIGFAIGLATWASTRPLIQRAAARMDNDKASVNRLFTVPLICAAALLSFAHGSNDVANAIGPLAAIHDAIQAGGVGTRAAIPLWILVLGALGLSMGLALYGPRLIRTVGSEITDIDPMRAYCIAMSATITVIIASQLGLPISTTHVTIGAVFGVGFLREYLKSNYQRIIEEIEAHHRDQAAERSVVEDFLKRFEAASIEDKGRMLAELKAASKAHATPISKRERKGLRKVYRRELVKRSVMARVIAAWVITVPASALMAALLYYTIRGAMLP